MEKKTNMRYGKLVSLRPNWLKSHRCRNRGMRWFVFLFRVFLLYFYTKISFFLEMCWGCDDWRKKTRVSFTTWSSQTLAKCPSEICKVYVFCFVHAVLRSFIHVNVVKHLFIWFLEFHIVNMWILEREKRIHCVHCASMLLHLSFWKDTMSAYSFQKHGHHFTIAAFTALRTSLYNAVCRIFNHDSPSRLHLDQCYSSFECTSLSFLQPLTIFQRSLTTMQIQIQSLLQFAVPLFPTAEVSHTNTKLFT